MLLILDGSRSRKDRKEARGAFQRETRCPDQGGRRAGELRAAWGTVSAGWVAMGGEGPS